MHPTPALIKALQDREVPQTLGELLLANHLASVCASCEEALLATRQRAAGHFVDRLGDIWSVPVTAESRAAARRVLHTLVGKTASHSERLHRIERGKLRSRSPLLVAVVLAEARSCVAADPGASFRYAEIACAIARDAKMPPTCLPLALGYAGNARRAAGELRDAKRHFGHAYHLLDVLKPAPHPWVLAEIASLEGSLLKDAGKFASAERCLLYAGDRFEDADDTTGRARTLVKLAAVHHLAGEPQRALDGLESALESLRGMIDPKLLVSALHNYVLFLSEADHLDRAMRLLDHLRPVYDWYPEFEERHLWLRATVARSQGDPHLAEDCFRLALQAFLDRGSAFFSAFVALDLADLLINAGRTGEVVAVTSPLPPLFRSQGIHRQATAAIVLFHQAASRQELTEHLLSRLRAFLERSQHDRTARFSPR